MRLNPRRTRPSTPQRPTAAATSGGPLVARPGPTPRPGSLTLAIVVHNGADTIGDALRSVASQSRPPDEILAVDDGSTDDTAAVLTLFPEVRTVHQPNGGRPVARNTALAAASGEFVMWLDADDVLEPWAVEHHRSVIDREPAIDVVHGDLVLVDDRGVPIRAQRYEEWADRNDELLGRCAYGNEVPNPSTAFRRSTLVDVGGYDPALRRCEDYDMLARLAPVARFRHSGDVVLRYRVSDEVARGVAVENGDAPFVLTVVRRLIDRHPLAALAPTRTGTAAERDALASFALAVRIAHLGDLRTARHHAAEAAALSGDPAAHEIVAVLDAALATDGPAPGRAAPDTPDHVTPSFSAATPGASR